MTLREARKYFREFIAPTIPKNDIPALNEAFNVWTDSLAKDGTITEKQYDTCLEAIETAVDAVTNQYT